MNENRLHVYGADIGGIVMKKYMVSWGISLVYSIIIAVCAMTISSFLYIGLNGNPDTSDTLLATAIVIATMVEAVIISRFRYKRVTAGENKVNILLYWGINIGILAIPYLFLIWLLVR